MRNMKNASDKRVFLLSDALFVLVFRTILHSAFKYYFTLKCLESVESFTAQFLTKGNHLRKTPLLFFIGSSQGMTH